MSSEAPKQIDLNQDLQTQGIQLGPDQLKKYESFLNKLEEQEKQDIIYLTKGELEKLMFILSEDDSVYNDADFDEFIQEQRNEGLNTNDFDNLTTTHLLGEGFEKFEGIDELTQQVLFQGDESILGSLNISPKAQDSMGVALSLATIEHISSQDISENTDIMAEALKIMGEQLSELKTLADSQLILGQSSTIAQLNISGMGENNSIFMNPEKGKDFFLKVLLGEIDTKAMETMLEDANQDTAIEGVDISHIPAEIQEHAGNLLEKIEAFQNGNTDGGNVDTDNIEEVIEEAEENGNTGIMRFIENLLKMLGLDQLMSGVVKSGEDNEIEDEVTQSEETIDLAPEELQANQKLIDLIDALSPANQEHIKRLQGSPALTTRIRRIIEGISTKQTFEETFKEVFDSGDVLSSNGIRAGRVFEEYDFEMSLPEGLDEIEKSVRMLEEYSRYRNSDGVRDLTSGRTTWQIWAEKRQAENWKVGGR